MTSSSPHVKGNTVLYHAHRRKIQALPTVIYRYTPATHFNLRHTLKVVLPGTQLFHINPLKVSSPTTVHSVNSYSFVPQIACCCCLQCYQRQQAITSKWEITCTENTLMNNITSCPLLITWRFKAILPQRYEAEVYISWKACCPLLIARTFFFNSLKTKSKILIIWAKTNC